MTRNRFGVIHIEGSPGYAEYQAEYGETGVSEDPPSERDLQIPDDSESALKEISDKLSLNKLSHKESVTRIGNFFETNFTYSLKNARKTSINRFLQHSRSGHCEYFATAGVLILRYSGIPARYAVGFSAHEWNDMEKQVVVRTRHAHAWTLAWVNGKWVDADFTPSTWRDSESESISQWHWLTDIWDYGIFLFQRWKWEKTDRGAYAFWLIVPLALILARRFLASEKTRRTKKPTP
ncbi:MAG: transglutaminase domain-containing protein [Desulfobacteraceae bacterium]|nr:transglutaminase domain-containing protein [Desulfobacteraceae bacterium]